METNWIILAAVLVGAIALVIYLIVRNNKDEKEVIESFNAEDDLENEAKERKDDKKIGLVQVLALMITS